MTFNKGGHTSKKEKRLVSHKTRLVFMHGGSRNSATFKMELDYIFTGKIKNEWKMIMLWRWPQIHYICFVHMFFTVFWKHQLLSVSLTFCFNSKTNYKNKNWYQLSISSSGVILFHLTGFWRQLSLYKNEVFH